MKKSDMIVKKYIPIGEILKGTNFKTFERLRKAANKIVKPYRDDWFMSVMIKNGVIVNPAIMTRREMVELYEANQISMCDEGDIYRIYKGEEIIGEWNNSRLIRINKDGKLMVKIEYVIV